MSDLAVPSSYQSVIGLGTPLSIYKSGSIYRLISAIFCLAIFLSGLGVIYYGLVVYPQPGSRVSLADISIFIGIGGLIILGALYWARRIFSHWNESAVVYQKGLAHSNGRETQAFNWDQVESITSKVIQSRQFFIPTGKSHNYTIVSKAGDKIILDDTISKVEVLYNQIGSEIIPRICARCEEAFTREEWVQFGPISINKGQGIRYGSKVYSWDDIESVSVFQGNVMIKPMTGNLFRGVQIPVFKIPNIEVLLTILSKIFIQFRQTA